MLAVLLEREDAVTLDTHVLGLTLVTMVAHPLRRILTAPSSVHLRGGCAVLLQRVRQLEKTLHLGALPLHLKECPNRLPDNQAAASAASSSAGAAAYGPPGPGGVSGEAKPARRTLLGGGALSRAPQGGNPPSGRSIAPAGLRDVSSADTDLRRALNSSMDTCRSAVDALRCISGIGGCLIEVLGRDADSWEPLYGLDAEVLLESRWREQGHKKGMYAADDVMADLLAPSDLGLLSAGLGDGESAQLVHRSNLTLTHEVSTADAAELLFPFPDRNASEYRPHHHAHQDWLQREEDGTTRERLAAHLARKRRALMKAAGDHGHGRGFLQHAMREISAVRRMDKEHSIMRFGARARAGAGAGGEESVGLGLGSAPGSPGADSDAIAALAGEPNPNPNPSASPGPPESPHSPQSGGGICGNLWRKSKLALSMTSISSPRRGGLDEALAPSNSSRAPEEPPLAFGTLRQMGPRERAEFARLVESLAKVDKQLQDMRSGQQTQQMQLQQQQQQGAINNPGPYQTMAAAAAAAATAEGLNSSATSSPAGKGLGLGFGKAAAAATAAAAAKNAAAPTRGPGPIHDAGLPSRLGLGMQADLDSRIALDYSQTFSASGFALPAGVGRGDGMLSMLRLVGRGEGKPAPSETDRLVGLGQTDHGVVMGVGLEDETLHPHLSSFRMLGAAALQERPFVLGGRVLGLGRGGDSPLSLSLSLLPGPSTPTHTVDGAGQGIEGAGGIGEGEG